MLVPMIIKNRLSGYFLLGPQSTVKEKKWDEFIHFSLFLLKNEYHIYSITYLVKKDELTGLFNKRSLLDSLEKLYQKSQNENRLFSIAVLDIDKFKHYNDTYGHAVGDHILKSVGKNLNDLGKIFSFTPYRYGGEEIVLLFENIGKHESVQKMDQVRKAIMDSNYSTEEWFLKLTISVGVADNSKTSSFMEMFEQADIALYHAKKEGRNRVCSF
jgi:diguanylate cyclase (GGDEF)-like protein